MHERDLSPKGDALGRFPATAQMRERRSLPSRGNIAADRALGARPAPEGSDMAEPPRRFPPPWRADKIAGGYVVRDANGQALAYLYSRNNENIARQALKLRSLRICRLHRPVRRYDADNPRRADFGPVHEPHRGAADGGCSNKGRTIRHTSAHSSSSGSATYGFASGSSSPQAQCLPGGELRPYVLRA